jgi:hypothetical protein
MRQIEELPFYRGPTGARIAYKKNAKGERVVAIARSGSRPASRAPSSSFVTARASSGVSSSGRP